MGGLGAASCRGLQAGGKSYGLSQLSTPICALCSIWLLGHCTPRAQVRHGVIFWYFVSIHTYYWITIVWCMLTPGWGVPFVHKKWDSLECHCERKKLPYLMLVCPKLLSVSVAVIFTIDSCQNTKRYINVKTWHKGEPRRMNSLAPGTTPKIANNTRAEYLTLKTTGQTLNM